VALGALVLAGAAVALVIATSGSGPRPRLVGTRTTNAPLAGRRNAAGFNPSTITVAVLNGTAVNQLAHRIAARLVQDGYREGTVATASDQTMTATVVAYLPGFRSAALHVAAALQLKPASVRPIDQPTEQVACQGARTCAADVVVTVGADLAGR
jgi:hypothetical protein